MFGLLSSIRLFAYFSKLWTLDYQLHNIVHIERAGSNIFARIFYSTLSPQLVICFNATSYCWWLLRFHSTATIILLTSICFMFHINELRLNLLPNVCHKSNRKSHSISYVAFWFCVIINITTQFKHRRPNLKQKLQMNYNAQIQTCDKQCSYLFITNFD